MMLVIGLILMGLALKSGLDKQSRGDVRSFYPLEAVLFMVGIGLAGSSLPPAS